MKTRGLGKIWKDDLRLELRASPIVSHHLNRHLGPDFSVSRSWFRNFEAMRSIALSTRATTIFRETLAKRGIKREDKAAITSVAKEVAVDFSLRLRLGAAEPENVKKVIKEGMKLPAKDFIPFVRKVLDAAESHAPIFDKIDWMIMFFYGGGVRWRGRLIPPLAMKSDWEAGELAGLFGRKLSPHMYKKRRQRLGIPSLSKRLRKLSKNKTAPFSVILDVLQLGDNGR